MGARSKTKRWVAATRSIENVVTQHPEFGEVVPLPFAHPKFAFTIPVDGSLPKNGVLPSLIDHQADPTKMSDIPDFGARLVAFTLQHPEPETTRTAYEALGIDRPPAVRFGLTLRYEAEIETADGLRELW